MSHEDRENLKKILREADPEELDASLQRSGLSHLRSLKTNVDISTLIIDKLDSSKLRLFLSLLSRPTADRSLDSMDNYVSTTNRSSPRHNNGSLQRHAKTVRDYYMKSTNTLKIALVPTTKSNIYDVKDLHVPIILRRKKITPDLNKTWKISPQEVFSNGDEGRQKKFLVGPSGVGKTTEIKMWLYEWCTERERSVNPLGKFLIVFYVDCAKLSPASSLGEAVTHQCFPKAAGITPANVEELCRECPDDILVILDNFGEGECRNGLDKDKTLYQLIHGESFQGLNLLVVTTPSAIIDCEDVYGSYDNIQAIDGISEESVQHYIMQVFQDRLQFADKALNYLRTRQLVPDMASSPVLLCGFCQIVKWRTHPDDFGVVDRVTDLVGRFIEVYMKHKSCSQSDGRNIQRRNVSNPATSGGPAAENISGATSSIYTQLPAENTSHMGPRSLESGVGDRHPEISHEDVLNGLALVAFGCFNENPSRCRMSEADFNMCHDKKNFIISRGCMLGLLRHEGEDEICPTSSAATEGKVIQFKNKHVRHYLAAYHLKRLIEGTNEERSTFTDSLRKVKSANDCQLRREVLKHACGLSQDAGKEIIEHVIDVKKSESRIRASDGRSRECTEQAERFRELTELLLELNYEAKLGETFNGILVPALHDARLVSPTELIKRSLKYFLQNLPGPSSLTSSFKIVVSCQTGDTGMNPHDFGPNVDVVVSDSLVSCRDSSAVQERLASSILPPSNCEMTEITVTSRTKNKISLSRKLAPTFQAPYYDDVAGIPNTEVPSGSGATASIDALASVVSEELVLGTESLTCNTSGTSTGLQDNMPNISDMKWINPKEIEYGDFIAEGRFGEVFEAKWKDMTVAVKRVKNVGGCIRNSVIKEIKINSRLNHKNIVKIYAYTDYRPGKSGHYRIELVMQLIDGVSLEDAIFAERIPFLKADEGKLTVAMKICDAIAHIHAQGFTHSDIKPSNVLVRERDSEPFVCDFGLGHAFITSGMSLASSGKRTGVQRWTSPEAGEGKEASPASDIWSLSSVLLELFTRKKMWDGIKYDFQLMNKLKEDDVTPPILQHVQDKSLQHLFKRCFSKDPGNRPSAQELKGHFRTALTELRSVYV